MKADLLGELVGRTIAGQVGQITARCADMRRDFERQLAEARGEVQSLRAELMLTRERVAVLEAGGRRGFLLEAGDYPPQQRRIQ